MPPLMVTRKLWVMAQPEPEDFPGLRDRGFTSVINNRPDGEAPDQPGSAVEAAAADAAGLGYVHIPVESRNITLDHARRFQEALDAAQGPVLAHCRSGARSFFLWIMAGDLEGKRDDEILALAEEINLDPKAVAERLEARRKRSEGRTA